MTANACVVYQNINCNAQTFGFGKNFRCGIWESYLAALWGWLK
ncbi:hypothetical protein [Neisseria sp. DTU_2021_1001991_1_SI_NGA_ILE_055]|nr:hypothetical protein [Neisseria sp. DTU_2021_1001991_1_SI_NGA_ILE_055]WNS84126.1 hypothetical protein RRV97_03065 [Neisseria sp. DTU_2021_1001991_1_SI_NGA_ILE_055]